MSSPLNSDRETSHPFLMGFLQPLERPAGLVVYDSFIQLNVLAGQDTIAVCAGLDVKTLGAVAEN